MERVDCCNNWASDRLMSWSASLCTCSSKGNLIFCDFGGLCYLLQVPADVKHVARRVLIRYGLEQRNADNNGINQYTCARRHLALHIRKPIQVVQNTYDLAMYKCRALQVLVLPDIPGASRPLQNLYRISKQPDIQSSR